MKILTRIGQFIAEKIMLVYNVIKNHKNDKNNPHEVTKHQVGLGNVDNTSDVDKPISNATQKAIGNISKDLNTVEGNINSINTKIEHIKSGEIIVGKSEYAQKLGTEQDNFTKNAIEQALNALLSDADIDPETFILTFTYRNGTQKTFDLPIEMTVKDGRYDEETKELVLVLVSDQEIRIPATGLIKVYIGKESTTTTVSINERTGEVSVDVKQGSITKEHLTTELQSEINKLINLPENGNEIFATKEELEKSGAQIFELDFTKEYSIDNSTDESVGTLEDAIIADIKASLGEVTIEDLTKRLSYFSIKYENVYLLIPIKLDTEPGATTTRFIADTNKQIYLENASNTDDYIDFDSLRINLSYRNSRLSVSLVETPVEKTARDFNLTVNANVNLAFDTPIQGFRINTGAHNYSKTNGCDTFDVLLEYIQDRNVAVMPSINLKTPTSGSLYPAIVDSTYTLANREIYSISIKYIKEINGVQKLITETLDFNEAGGLSKVVDTSATFTYSKYAEDVYSSPCLIHVENGTEAGIYTVNTEEVEAYYQKAMAGMDKNNVRIVWSGIPTFPVTAIVQENVIILGFSLPSIQGNNNALLLTVMNITCVKTNDAWTCTVLNKAVTIDPDDYMKVSNIHVVSEHPTDLTSYPDGSIFIKNA